MALDYLDKAGLTYLWSKIKAALDGKAPTEHGTHVTFTTTKPVMDGTAAVGSAATVSRSDHVHPTDTSRVPTTRKVAGKALSADVTLTASDVGALPDDVVPITKGGTGKTGAFAAIEALGGLSVASIGTKINSGDNIDSYVTPGVFYSQNATITASLQGTTPFTGSGFRLVVSKGYATARIWQFAFGTAGSAGYYRGSEDTGATWAAWSRFAKTSDITASAVGLGNVDNTSDADKPVSTAQQEALDGKVDKVGDTMTGSLIINGGRTDGKAFVVDNGTHRILFEIGTGGENRGIYDSTTGRWLINYNANGEALIDGKGVRTYKWLSGGTALATDDDLNDYYKVGNYYCRTTIIARTLENCPTSEAFRMEVGYALGLSNVYQLITEYKTGRMWYRYTATTETATPSWNSWSCIGALTSTNPSMNGTASPGTSNASARADHVHPTDTSRAAAVHSHAISDVTGLQTALDGKAQSSHEHSADDIMSGTLPVARGGTGQTTAQAAGNAFMSALNTTSATGDVTDDTLLATSAATGETNTWYRRPATKLWNYIKSKCDALYSAVGHTHTAADVGAVPTTRKVAGKALSADITLSASDVGAASAVHGIYYGTCATAAATQTKTVTLSDATGFSLTAGISVRVKFTNAQTYNGQFKLNVASTGATDVTYVGATASLRYNYKAGEVVDFVYDGTNWVMVDQGIATTTYYGMTKLTSSLTSTSTELAASAAAAKALNDAKADKTTIAAVTLTTSGWSGGSYSLESTYPAASYDIEVGPNGDSCTAAQLEAWAAAKPVGSATTNVIKALGTVPTVNIPVIVKVTPK